MVVRVNYNRINRRLQEAASERAQELAQEIYRDIVLATPVDTGTLRNSWELQNTETGFIIRNEQDYASNVDDGSSAQAPGGIIDPVLSKYNLQRRGDS